MEYNENAYCNRNLAHNWRGEKVDAISRRILNYRRKRTEVFHGEERRKLSIKFMTDPLTSTAERRTKLFGRPPAKTQLKLVGIEFSHLSVAINSLIQVDSHLPHI